MSHPFRRFFFTISLLICLLIPVASFGADRGLSLGIGVEFATGDYGADTTTSSFAIPVSLEYYPAERLDFGLSIPYLYQSRSTTTAAGLLRFRTSSSQQGMGGGRRQRRSGSSSAAAGFDTGQSASGIGDLTLEGGYLLLQEEKQLPQLRASLFVKFPTADKDKGLGTGEFDGGFGLDLAKWIGDWKPFMGGSYTIQGKTPDLSLRNYVSYNFGTAYQLTDNFRPALLLKGATPPAEDSGALLELRLKGSYRLSRTSSVDAYLARGLTTGSPNFGVGIAATVDF